LCCQMFLSPFLAFIFLTLVILLLTCPVLDLKIYYGVSKYSGTFLMLIFYFSNLTTFKIKPSNAGSCNKMLVTPCILLHGTPFPFSGN
jgi:hypothetical protein